MASIIIGNQLFPTVLITTASTVLASTTDVPCFNSSNTATVHDIATVNSNLLWTHNRRTRFILAASCDELLGPAVVVNWNVSGHDFFTSFGRTTGRSSLFPVAGGAFASIADLPST